MDVLKVAIIGIGNMGSAHALCISNGEIEGLCLCAVCDVEERKLNTFAEKYPHISVYTDYRELLKNNMINTFSFMAKQAENYSYYVPMEIAGEETVVHMTSSAQNPQDRRRRGTHACSRWPSVCRPVP